MFGLGATELILILVIVVVLFGGSKLPEIGSGVGKMISNFKKASRETDEEEKSHKDTTKEKKA